MKYNTKYNTVEAIVYSGYNYKELNDFTDHQVVWNSSQMNWSENYPPKDLQIVLRSEKVPQKIKKGDYVVKLDDNKYYVANKENFEAFFEGVTE